MQKNLVALFKSMETIIIQMGLMFVFTMMYLLIDYYHKLTFNMGVDSLLLQSIEGKL